MGYAHGTSNEKLVKNDLIEQVELPDKSKHDCVKGFACEFSLVKETLEDGTSYNNLVAHMRFEESCLSDENREALNTLTCYSTRKLNFLLKFVYSDTQGGRCVSTHTLGLFNLEFEMSSL